MSKFTRTPPQHARKYTQTRGSLCLNSLALHHNMPENMHRHVDTLGGGKIPEMRQDTDGYLSLRIKREL